MQMPFISLNAREVKAKEAVEAGKAEKRFHGIDERFIRNRDHSNAALCENHGDFPEHQAWVLHVLQDFARIHAIK